MKKDKRLKFSEGQIKAAQEECGHKVEKLDNISSTGSKVIGYCTAAAFWIGILGHVWGFFILGWLVLIAFAIIIKPFTMAAEKKEYLACCKYRRWDLIRSGCIFDPVTGERLQ